MFKENDNKTNSNSVGVQYGDNQPSNQFINRTKPIERNYSLNKIFFYFLQSSFTIGRIKVQPK